MNRDSKMRFALTCRFIKPEMLDAAELWKGEYDPQLAAEYNGDVEVPAST